MKGASVMKGYLRKGRRRERGKERRTKSKDRTSGVKRKEVEKERGRVTMQVKCPVT